MLGGVEVDRNGLEILERGECLRLLGLETLGRIGLTSGALPIVLPVSFHLDGERILVRTGPGTKLDAATRDAVVAFEVDDFDPVSHTGWSVAVTGTAHEIVDPTELASAPDQPRACWSPGGGATVITISTELISGRRITT